MDFKFKLRGATWTVKLVTEKELMEEIKQIEKNCEALMGYTVFERQICYVRTDMHPDQVKSTMYHEICHAILAPLNGSYAESECDSVDLESTCNLIGEALFEIVPQMKNWPALVMPAWISFKK
jgi:hypothetical protein